MNAAAPTVSENTMTSSEAMAFSDTNTAAAGDASVVYMTTDISPEGLMAIYEALGAEPTGEIAMKLSTGENGSNYLRP